MVKKIKAARTFLHAEIDKLAPASLFNVILTNGEGCVSFKPDLCTPTNEIKTALRDFLGKATTGGTDDLINALRIAKKSDASIVLITDGDVGNPTAIAEFLKRIPSRHEVKVELFDHANVSAKLVTQLREKTDGRSVEIFMHGKES